MRRTSITAAVAALAVTVVSTASAQDMVKARKSFETCAACHTGDPDGLGPDLKGVVGRRAGTLPGFRYSAAMKKSGITWTPATLKDFLQHPQKTVPGNRMPFAGIANPAEAEAIAKYLAMQK